MSAIDVMRKALDALEYHTAQTRPVLGTEAAIAALRAELERIESNPIAPSIPALSESDTDAGWDAAGGGDAYAAWGVGASWAYALAAQRAGVQIKDPMQELADDSKQIGLEY